MNKELGLKLIITGDGKVAVQASKEVQAALAGVAAEAHKSGAASKQMAVDIERNSKTASASVDSLTASLKSMAVGVVGFAAITGTAKGILQTNIEMERLRASLTSTIGTIQGGQAAFQSIVTFAKNTPFEVAGLTQTYVMLQNMGLRPTTAVMEALTNQASKLGGSQETLTSIALQLGQAYSKGKLQQEDMVILAERGVPIYQLLSEVTGANASELAKMSEQGTITRDVMDKLIVKMNEMATGSNATAMDTLGGKISNLSDSWHQFEDTLLNDKSEGLIKSIVASASGALDILSRNMSSTLDAQIAHAQARIKSFSSLGGVGQFAGDMLGYDPNIEKNRLDTLLGQKNGETNALKAGEAKAKAADEAKKITQTLAESEQWYSDVVINEEQKREKQREQSRKAAESASHQATKSAASKAEQLARQAATELKQLNDRAQAMREGANPDVAFVANIEEYTKAYNRGAISIQDYVFWLTKLDDTRNQAKGSTPDTGWADITAIQDEVSLQRSQDATKGVDDYVKSLDRAKDSASALSDVSSSIFDGALGGVNLIAGAFNNLTKSIADTTKELEANSAARIANDAEPESDKKSANRIKIANEEKRLNNEQLKSSLSGIRQISSATASMFKENTNARRAFNVIALAASVTERMADIAGLGIKAASAVLEQGKGDPYTAFARMAAMAAIVGSVLSAAGAGTFQFGGSSVPKGQVPTSPDSGTVLGDPAAKSESISKTYTLLQDIHATEYRELRGINSGVAAMNQGITDSITKLFQAGGLQTPNIPGLGTKMSGIGSFLTSIDPVNKMGLDPIGKFILKGLFGTTKTSITGGGIYAGGNSLASILNGGDITAQQYTEITKTKKSWFSKSSKVSEVMGPVNAEFQDSLSLIFRGMGTSMLAMSSEFGDDMTNSINNYVIPKLKISLYGLSSEQMIKTLNNVLSTQLDTMTSAIFGSMIKKYQKLGEGMFETATRLVSEKAIVLDAIDLVGSSFKGDAIDMADGLVQLAGGIKEFQAQFDDYYRKFYSESEQLANTTRRLTASLADMNITLPDSRNAYRDLVNAQKLDTEAGRERYDQLLKLSTAADVYYESMEKLRESMKLLTQDNFKSAVDYKRYLGLASLSGIKAATDLLPANPNTTFMPTGSPNQLLPGIASTPMTTAFTTVAESNNAVANEVKQLRIEQQAQALAIAQNTADMAKLLKRWEGDGLPATRVIA
ncbi:MAG: tape measure protein [Rhodocyclaceae bacterium]|nr:tape measure protein [Rhodocyclaceae bacterium]